MVTHLEDARVKIRKKFNEQGSIPLNIVLLNEILERLASSSPTASGSTQLAESITISSSTGEKLRINQDGSITVAVKSLPGLPEFALEGTLKQILNKLPTVLDGLVQVKVANQITDYATQQTQSTILERTPSLTTDKRIPTESKLIPGQSIDIGNQITGFARQETLESVVFRLPELTIGGRMPVEATLLNSSVAVTNQITGFALNSTVVNLLSRIPELSNNSRIPTETAIAPNQSINIGNQITGFALESTAKTLLDRTPALSQSGRTPTEATIAPNQTINLGNQITGFASEETLNKVLAKLPPTPVASEETLLRLAMFMRSPMQFYTSKEGGYRSYNATATANIGSTAGTVCIFHNPGDSGIDVFIYKFALMTKHSGTFQRYRQGNITVTANGASVKALNRAGMTSMVPKAKLFTPLQATVTGGDAAKPNYVPANDEKPDIVDGTIILKPGQNLYWTYQSSSSTSDAAIEVVWWELPTT